MESDPDLARLFARHTGGDGGSAPTFLLVAGLALLVTGSIVAAVPVAMVGLVLSLFALFTAHVRPTGMGRPSIA